jgi:hypothetical protein
MVRSRSIQVGDQVEVSGFYKPHDKFRVELKFEYFLNQNTPESDFLVESYLFIPQALGLTTNLIQSTDFFTDIRSYMRYAVQPMELLELADFENELSPMARVYHFLLTGKKVDRSNQPTNFFLHESKLITCIFKETVKVEFTKIDELLKSKPVAIDTVEFCKKMIVHLHGQVAQVQKQFYLINDLVKKSKFIDYDDIDDFKGVFEFFYYEMNLFFVSVLERSKEIELLGGSLKEFKKTLMIELELFREFAKANKFISLNENSTDRDRERFIYREGKLKKFVSSILFLNRDIKSNKKTEELFFAFAAGLAMLFAVLMAVLTAYKWDINSVPWMLSVVLVYMIRDRGKAWLQEKFRNISPVYLAHRTQKLVEENVGKVGSLKEWLVFKNYEQIPLDIMDVRSHNREMVGAFKKSEDILYYKKQIKLKNKLISSNHQRVNKVANILRFNMKRFCVHMDDPHKVVKTINSVDEIGVLLGRKVYHLNIVFKITTNYGKVDAKSENLNLKIIISRDGIERIESPIGQQMEKLFELTWYGGQV